MSKIEMSSIYSNSPNPPRTEYLEIAFHLINIEKAEQANPEFSESIRSELHFRIAFSIFASNCLASVGGSFGITTRIVDSILFKIINKDIGILHREESSFLEEAGRNSDPQSVNISRKDIVRHARAVEYLWQNCVLMGESLTERLLVKAHSHLMLYTGTKTGGYRKNNTQVPDANWVLGHEFVPTYMAKLIADYNAELYSKEITDPIELAARCSTMLACIRPFESGNGRMSRLLINMILFSFMGMVVDLGSHHSKAERYLKIRREAYKTFLREEEAEVKTSHLELGAFIAEEINITFNTMLKSR